MQCKIEHLVYKPIDLAYYSLKKSTNLFSPSLLRASLTTMFLHIDYLTIGVGLGINIFLAAEDLSRLKQSLVT